MANNNELTVFLCEKPSQARTLANFIGADTYAGGAWHTPTEVVIPARGHMMNLVHADVYLGTTKWNPQDLPVMPNQWVWEVSKDPQVQAQFELIGTYLKQATHVVLATDPDDEGEVIGREILTAHGYKGRVSRLWASALNTNGLQMAMDNLLPLSATEGYYRAGRVRRMLDWLFGTNFSRAYSAKLGKTTNVGRVKTRLLAELVTREGEISSRTNKFAHVVNAKLNGVSVSFQGEDELLPAEIQSLLATGSVQGVVLMNEMLQSSAKQLPYSLTTLLADAADLGISLKNGDNATQTLYEAGVISYPRANSKTLPSSNSSEFAAHSAIHLTGELPSDATSDMTAIYGLIGRNILMQSSATEPKMIGHMVVDVAGYRLTMKAQAALESIHLGDSVQLEDIKIKMVPVATPERFSEATLMRWMDNASIGTDATRVSVITSMVEEGVATLQNGKFMPTQAGFALINKLASEVVGNTMGKMVEAAVEKARRGVDTDGDLIEAVKWIVKEMPN